MELARFLSRNLQGYRRLIVVTLLVAFAVVATDICNVFPLKFIIDKLSGQRLNPIFPGSVAFLDFFSTSFHASNGQAVVTFSVALFILLGLLNALLSFILLSLTARIAKKLTTSLSKQLFEHLQRLSVAWHDHQEEGNLVQRVTANIAALEQFVGEGLPDVQIGTLTIVGVIAIMFVTHVQFTLLFLCMFPFLILMMFIASRTIKIATQKAHQADEQVARVATGALAQIIEIKALTLQSFLFDLFHRKQQADLHMSRLQTRFLSLVDVMLMLSIAILAGCGASIVLAQSDLHIGWLTLSKDTMTLGLLALFLVSISKLYQPLHNLPRLIALVTHASQAAERIQEVMEQVGESLELPAGYSGALQLQGAIDYEDVFFCYETPGTLILKGITLHIAARKKVALVGPSGSGKTTLANLLPRFYDIAASGGHIKIDNVDIHAYPLSILRRNISIIPQDSLLFDGSVRENLKIGRPAASDAEMIQAAEQACIHETIMKMPSGYNAQISNQGKTLSRGQRQRLAIARAILRNTPIVIMDEPTAALDVASEAEVMRALDGLAAGRTVLILTHRLNTIGNVDEIVVIQDGQVAEQGTYKALKERDGVFAHLLKTQHPVQIDPDLSQSIIQTASEPPDSHSSKAHVSIEIEGKVVGKRELDKQVLTVGRMQENDVAIPVLQVSRLHAKILWKNNAWVIEDAESTNKLHYNSQLLEQHVFAPGDYLYLAPDVALIYEQESHLPAPPYGSARLIPTPPTPATPSLPFQKAMVVIEIDGKVIGTHKLDKGRLTVGSLVSNDIAIPSSFISRQHAQVEWERGVWVIKDGGSKNGLHFNGQRVTQHAFAHGHRVYLAPTVLLLYQIMP